MKNRIGKISIATLFVIVISLLVINFVASPLTATPINNVDIQLGAYTGPETGAAQDDNVKASLDLAHTDLDAIIVDTTAIQANQNRTGTTIPGVRYVTTVTTTDANDNDLFDIAGGAIVVESFVGLITTNIVAAAGDVKILLDADAGWVNHDLSTAVEMNGDLAGQRIMFSNANPAVLTPVTVAAGGSSTLMSAWYVGEGMLEMDNADEDATGVIQWVMVWTPVDSGTTVTAIGDGSSN